MRWFEIVFRFFCAGILAGFSCVLLFICHQALRTVVSEPAKFGLTVVLVFTGCAALAFFLFLLTYRLAVGRGRKADGGLFPPAMVKGILLWNFFDKLGEWAFLMTMKLLSFWRRSRGRSQFVESNMPKAAYEAMLLSQYRAFTKGELKPRTQEELVELMESRRKTSQK